ncbi:MAG: histidine phosphatase family protein [Candidatus Parcubacteria bacterium]|nr:histidine phosphatase family protein [Candidatus Parcubacteria bacterium]
MEKVSWIYFVRHAESGSNGGEEFRGHTKDQGLSVTGEKQAKALAKILKKEKFDLIILSPFKRAQDTAKPFLKIAGHKIPVKTWPVQEFVYHSLGKKRKKNLAEKLESAKKYWLAADPDYRDSKEAETYRDLIKRIELVRKKIIQDKHQKILIVSHGHFIKHFTWRLLHETLEINKESMPRARDFTRAMRTGNTAIIKIAKIGKKLYVSEINERHLKNS